MRENRAIVDAHHHLWDLEACRYPWLMEQGVVRFFGDPAPIQRNYLVSDLRSDAGRYDLTGSVHIQVGVATGDEVTESKWVDATADRDRLPSALVAFCDLSHPDARDVLTRQREVGRVKGIRHIIGRSAEEDRKIGSDALLENPQWLGHLALLPSLDLSFDLQMIPPQAKRAQQIVADIPELRTAICHCGSPWDQSSQGLLQWRHGLQGFADNPNVFCKISGLAMFDHHWTVDSIRPVVETCIDVFGPDRCMFGSNFPVDKLHKTWDQVWGAYEVIASQYSHDEQTRLFGGTARAFYRF